MKKIITNIFFYLILCSFVSNCHRNKDNEYFMGEIKYFDDSAKVLKNVTSKVIPHNLFHGIIAIHDSLILCFNPRLPDYFFQVFNLDTGEEIGYFCSKGQGPNDVISVNNAHQLFMRGNDLFTILNPSHQRRLLFWNISQSIKQGKTVYDPVITYKQMNEDKSSRYNLIYYQEEDTLLAEVRSIAVSMEEARTPSFEQLTMNNNEFTKNFLIYKRKTVRNRKSKIPPDSFFDSSDMIKPDGSKMVQAMTNLPQINILDTRTGDVIGYRLKNSPDFSFFETDMQFMKFYYWALQADNNYIYTSYMGKPLWDPRKDEFPFMNIIHIYDWNGKHLYELITDRAYARIWLDTVRNRLYTLDDTDEVIYIDLNDLDL